MMKSDTTAKKVTSSFSFTFATCDSAKGEHQLELDQRFHNALEIDVLCSLSFPPILSLKSWESVFACTGNIANELKKSRKIERKTISILLSLFILLKWGKFEEIFEFF
ncbi:hypothetical protein RND81_08G214200 [Saponaria officinalis]|uniref:Uncharacterized protein n=1 Tax=Saponaria officinalis TaxID=3572 RepID=A0AAW1J9B9_SAPOF